MNSSAMFIEQLVAAHGPYLYRVAVSIVRDGPLAEDIVQDAFVTAMLQQHKLHANSNYRAWLSTIVVNRCRDVLRRRKVRDKWQHAWRAVRALVIDSAEFRPPEQSLEYNDLNSELWQAIEQLNENHQLPVILRYAHNMTAREIATLLNIKEGTVYSRLHNALRQLADILTSPNQQEVQS